MLTNTLETQAALSLPVLIALATLRGYEETRQGKSVYEETLADYVVQLKRNGIDTSAVPISGTEGEYWSKDIAGFISEGVVCGYIKQNSPIKFTPECAEMCKEAIADYTAQDEEIKPLLNRARIVLKINDLAI